MRAGGFYLGTHEPSWLRRRDVGAPLFVSRRRLAGKAKPLASMRPGAPTHRNGRRIYEAVNPWALDSGGFMELDAHGRWTLTPEDYVAELKHYRDAIGMLQWAAPQDWMCEGVQLARTGRTVYEHQVLTLQSVIELRRLLRGEGVHIIPVLQGRDDKALEAAGLTAGHAVEDYLRHVEMYRTAGINLADEPLVGLGSVCRRANTRQIVPIVTALHALGLKLHGFGVKTQALGLVGGLLETADSLAWSYGAREDAKQRRAQGLPGPRDDAPCGGIGAQGKPLKSCGNCLHAALEWRAAVLANVQTEGAQMGLGFRWAA